MSEALERQAVVDEALSWLATPYHHHGRIKGPGGGVDCLMLLAEIFERTGLVDRVDPGNYARDWHLHRNEEAYMQGLMLYAVQRPEGELPLAGDIALFRFGRTFSHGAIVVEAAEQLRRVALVHSYIGRGVIKGRMHEDPLDGRPYQFWTFWT
jgi:cell wall-associated NlpC family hydrolase